MKNIALTVTGLVMGIVLTAGIGGLAANTEAETISACVAKKDVLVLLAEGDTCRGNELLLTWNTQGPPGPQGPTGENGALALAGQSCPAGQFMTGVSLGGDMVCNVPEVPILKTWFKDVDLDGWGDDDDTIDSVGPLDGYVDRGADCNDLDSSINPDAIEIIDDGIDNDCDGVVDEVILTWYEDLDGDGWGNDDLSVQSEIQPAGHVAQHGDCDDTNFLINPGVIEIAGDGVDNNCDGVFD